jgi:dTMP kinase
LITVAAVVVGGAGAGLWLVGRDASPPAPPPVEEETVSAEEAAAEAAFQEEMARIRREAAELDAMRAEEERLIREGQAAQHRAHTASYLARMRAQDARIEALQSAETARNINDWNAEQGMQYEARERAKRERALAEAMYWHEQAERERARQEEERRRAEDATVRLEAARIQAEAIEEAARPKPLNCMSHYIGDGTSIGSCVPADAPVPPL